MSDQQVKPPVLAPVPENWSRMTPAEKKAWARGFLRAVKARPPMR